MVLVSEKEYSFCCNCMEETSNLTHCQGLYSLVHHHCSLRLSDNNQQLTYMLVRYNRGNKEWSRELTSDIERRGEDHRRGESFLGGSVHGERRRCMYRFIVISGPPFPWVVRQSLGEIEPHVHCLFDQPDVSESSETVDTTLPDSQIQVPIFGHIRSSQSILRTENLIKVEASREKHVKDFELPGNC